MTVLDSGQFYLKAWYAERCQFVIKEKNGN